jgi:predicted nucleic acid-binding protein
MTVVVLDTTLLSNFAHAQRPDLLRLLLGENVVSTATVMAELRRGEALGFVSRQNWSWLALVELSEVEQLLAAHYERQLDAGEAECLAVAVQRHYHFYSDDFAARRLARHEGITVSGTLGVLQKLVAQAHLSLPAADELLSHMIRQGYRSPVRSLRELP